MVSAAYSAGIRGVIHHILRDRYAAKIQLRQLLMREATKFEQGGMIAAVAVEAYCHLASFPLKARNRYAKAVGVRLTIDKIQMTWPTTEDVHRKHHLS